ncbi:MAG: response regulator [Bradyrhizobium sp.]|nr:response regulator [Bradyrhizobium sp.]
MDQLDQCFAPPPRGPRDPMSPAERGSLSEGPGAAAKVLIVEDDFLIALQTESALEEAGLQVVGVATSADEAVALAGKYRPAIAIMDVRLVGPRDGIDAAGELFREFGLRCVFASAHDDAATRARAQAFAPLGWLAKPYTMASLVAMVREALSRSAQ